MPNETKSINGIPYKEAVERMTLAMLKAQNKTEYTYGDVVRAMLDTVME